MYLIACCPPGWSDRATSAALAEAGIVAVPLSSLTLETARPPGLVLGYSGHGEATMARAVERMATCWSRKLVWPIALKWSFRETSLLGRIAWTLRSRSAEMPDTAPSDLCPARRPRRVTATPSARITTARASSPSSTRHCSAISAMSSTASPMSPLPCSGATASGSIGTARRPAGCCAARRRHPGLPDGQPRRWPGAGALRLPPFAQLPRGDGVRHRRDGRRPAEKEAGLNAFIERLYPGRTGLMRADPAAGTEGHDG